MTPRSWLRWGAWIGALVLVTAALIAARDRVDKAHVTLTYLLFILLGTVYGGRRLGLTFAISSFLLFTWFFLQPYGTLQVSDPLDWSILAVFVAVSGIAALMLHRLQREAIIARQRADEVNQFAAVGAEAINVAQPAAALRAVAEAIRASLRLDECRIHSGDAAETHGDPLVVWVRRTGRAALRYSDGTTHLSTGAEPEAGVPARVDPVGWLIPLLVRTDVVGVLELQRAAGLRPEPGERRFLRALSYYAALGIERSGLVATSQRVDEYRAADRIKDALLASVSHDLRTPLTTIKALAHDLIPLDERARSIEEEADRMNRLVVDLLDLSRLQGGVIPLHMALNAVDDLVGVVAQRVTGILGDQQLVISFDDGAMLVGRFDLVHAARVLVNLVENAHKYSAGSASVQLHVRREGEWLRFTVADRGPGVAPAERERIFEPFYRPAGAIADSGSAGLGLSISRRLSELQGGRLTYSPRDGGGSEFTLFLHAADLPTEGFES